MLDESLSALDVVSEAEIRAAVAHALPGRTIVTITHRLSSIGPDEQVMVLDRGRVLWSGRFAEHPQGLAQTINRAEERAV